MRKVLLGLAIGAAGAVVGYMVRRLEEKRAFEDFKDGVGACVAKGKKHISNLIDRSRNEMEYVEDRASQLYEQQKEKFQNME